LEQDKELHALSIRKQGLINEQRLGNTATHTHENAKTREPTNNDKSNAEEGEKITECPNNQPIRPSQQRTASELHEQKPRQRVERQCEE
jgi:hypothetical protein